MDYVCSSSSSYTSLYYCTCNIILGTAILRIVSCDLRVDVCICLLFVCLLCLLCLLPVGGGGYSGGGGGFSVAIRSQPRLRPPAVSARHLRLPSLSARCLRPLSSPAVRPLSSPAVSARRRPLSPLDFAARRLHRGVCTNLTPEDGRRA